MKLQESTDLKLSKDDENSHLKLLRDTDESANSSRDMLRM